LPLLAPPRTSRRRWLQISAGLTFLGALSVYWFLGEKLVEPVQRQIGVVPEGRFAIEVRIESESGSKLAGWYLDTPGARTTVLLAHPLHGDRRAMLGRAHFLSDAGYSCLLFDFQAHGESQGDAITFGFLEAEDLRAVVNYARALTPENQLVAIGWSLGGAAILLAQGTENLALDGVVLESVYPTIDEALYNRLQMRVGPLAAVFAPVLAWQLPLRLGIGTDDLRPIEHINLLHCPVLILGGSADEHTTPAETRALFAAALNPKSLVLFEGVRHTDLHQANQELYEARVLQFLAEL
jgi:uncharacterized protein